MPLLMACGSDEPEPTVLDNATRTEQADGIYVELPDTAWTNVVERDMQGNPVMTVGGEETDEWGD